MIDSIIFRSVNLGGNFGLSLGTSILAVLEFIDHAFRRISLWKDDIIVYSRKIISISCKRETTWSHPLSGNDNLWWSINDVKSASVKPRPNDRNISQLLGATRFARLAVLLWHAATDVVVVVGSYATIFKLEPATPNMSQHITLWPPTMLRSFGRGFKVTVIHWVHDIPGLIFELTSNCAKAM